MTNDEIKILVEDGAAYGYEISVKDISFCILTESFEDGKVAYRAMFGIADEYDSYIKDEKTLWLMREIASLKPEEVTFEENKAEIGRLIKDVRRELKDGKLTVKEAMTIESSLRVQLERTFGDGARADSNKIVVHSKYNAICESCGREMRVPTKEELIKEYGLDK